MTNADSRRVAIDGINNDSAAATTNRADGRFWRRKKARRLTRGGLFSPVAIYYGIENEHLHLASAHFSRKMRR